MTCIAWRGDLLAADRQLSIGDTKQETTKLFSFNGTAYSYTGDIDECNLLVEWYKNGANVFDYPEKCWAKKNSCPRLVVLKNTGLFVYEGTPYSTPYTGQYAAFGCGRETALGAMHAGADAVNAVRASIAHIISCGFGVDVIKIPQV